jgi:hypothetical protein
VILFDSGVFSSSGNHFALGCCHAEPYVRYAFAEFGAKVEHCIGLTGDDSIVQEKSRKVDVPGMCRLGFVSGRAGYFADCQSEQPWT